MCLMGMAMLWAPMLAAAWDATWGANVMDCCKGGMCPVGMMHSKMRHASPRQGTTEQAPMNCEHHGKSGMCDCSMACGSDSGRVLTAGVIFVLPGPARISQPIDARTLSSNNPLASFEQPFEPPYPPPRTPLFSL